MTEAQFIPHEAVNRSTAPPPALPQPKLPPPTLPTAEELEGLSISSILLNHREVIFERVANGENLDSMIRYFVTYALLFAAIFGATLGFFVFNLQIAIAGVKAPALILGTMGICLPALFTFNVLLGSKLSLKQTTATLAMATYIMATVLVSLAPIMLFFIVSTNSKNFVLLLTVIGFGIAGLFGIKMLWTGMNYLTERSGYQPNRQIVQIWTLIYIFVGTQLAWILRPFIGDGGDLVIFRQIEGNFYQAVFQIIVNLMMGG